MQFVACEPLSLLVLMFDHSDSRITGYLNASVFVFPVCAVDQESLGDFGTCVD